MADHIIHIKNMVCPRCITTVSDIFKKLSLEVQSIQLGEVITGTQMSGDQRSALEKELKNHGFELLLDHKSRLINHIKSIIIDQIHHRRTNLTINFSTLLSEELNHEYTSLSRLFSQVEGITIERYILKQKIEHAKELIFYEELTLSEIAFNMNYSSVAHLSTQFKKETGMTPTEFKKLKRPGHRFLDEL